MSVWREDIFIQHTDRTHLFSGAMFRVRNFFIMELILHNNYVFVVANSRGTLSRVCIVGARVKLNYNIITRVVWFQHNTLRRKSLSPSSSSAQMPFHSLWVASKVLPRHSENFVGMGIVVGIFNLQGVGCPGPNERHLDWHFCSNKDCKWCRFLQEGIWEWAPEEKM